MVKGTMNMKITSKNTIWNPWIFQLDANRSSKKSWLIFSAGNELELFDAAGQNVKLVFIFMVVERCLLLLRFESKMNVCYYWKSRVKWRVQFDDKYSSIPIIVTHHVSQCFLWSMQWSIIACSTSCPCRCGFLQQCCVLQKLGSWRILECFLGKISTSLHILVTSPSIGYLHLHTSYIAW